MRFSLEKVIAALLCCYAASSQAFTYMPMTDEALLSQSPVVLLGQVQSLSDAAVSNSGSTEYQVVVEEVLKGEVPVNVITVLTPGARQPTATKHWFPGMPSFESGESVVLFLQPRDDGSYGIMQLGLGAFHLGLDEAGEAVFFRKLEDNLRLPVEVPRSNAMNEIPRQATAFLQSLGMQKAFDSEQAETTRNNQNFTLLQRQNTLGQSLPPGRWFEFDEGQNVNIVAHSDGQPGMSGGGFNEVRAAINAWVNDAGSNVAYRYAGTTTADLGFRGNDDINAILFDDPFGDVDGSFDCNSGGVLAAGGFVATSNTRNYQGTAYSVILEADIVTNDNAGCFFGAEDGLNGAEVFAHELGHTLGLGHSCGDDDGGVLGGLVGSGDDCSGAADAAIMRAFPQERRRGATLGSDDRAGIAFLYEQTTASDPGPSDTGSDTAAGNDSGGGGGGGCAMSTSSAFDPTLWLLSLFALAYLARRRQLAQVSHRR